MLLFLFLDTKIIHLFLICKKMSHFFAKNVTNNNYFLFFKPMFPLPIAFCDFRRFFIRIVHVHHEEVGKCHL